MEMVQYTDTATDTEFRELRKGLVKELRAADKDLKGLKGAVDMIDKNRPKFPHIKDPELVSRKRFVEDAEKIIQDIRGGLDSPSVRQKMEEDDRRNKAAIAANSTDPNSALARENQNFVSSEKGKAMELIARQDEDLDHLGKAVDRLGEIGRDINTEVKEQTVLLDKLGEEIDESNNKLMVVQGALGKLLNTKDGCQIWTVVILAVVLILLIALVIWS